MTRSTTQANYDALDEKLRAVADTAGEALRTASDPAAEAPGPEALLQAVSAAMLSGHPLTAVAAAEATGRQLASDQLRPELRKLLRTTAGRKRQADQALEQAVQRAAGGGLSAREIAADVEVAAGTVKRMLEQPATTSDAATLLNSEPGEGTAPDGQREQIAA